MEVKRERHGGWIQTYTGKQMWPLDPEPHMVDIVDIAHSLSNMCRYAGHCTTFYSVAEHCVLMSRAADPVDKLWALMHDASEAYLVDVPSPLKPFIPGYRAWEARMMRTIAVALKIPGNQPYTVDLLDKRILNDEREQNMLKGGPAWLHDVSRGEGVPLGVTLEFWTPQWAQTEFLTAYYNLAAEAAVAA